MLRPLAHSSVASNHSILTHSSPNLNIRHLATVRASDSSYMLDYVARYKFLFVCMYFWGPKIDPIKFTAPLSQARRPCLRPALTSCVAVFFVAEVTSATYWLQYLVAELLQSAVLGLDIFICHGEGTWWLFTALLESRRMNVVFSVCMCVCVVVVFFEWKLNYDLK